MSSGTLRLGLAAAALIALWVLVYWWTPAPDDGVDIAFAPPEDGPALVLEELPQVPAPAPAEPAPAPAPAAPVTGATSRRPAQPAVIPPSFYRYTIRAGDTAQKISRRFYGKPDQWQAVMKANPKTDFQRLREGAEILVPINPANIQGVPATGASTARTPTGAEPTTESRATEDQAKEATKPEGFKYLVESGDTLSGLAQRFYGRAAAWPAIVSANSDLLGSKGEKLRPGMTIIIPPAPEPARERR